jgi:hypothetical protein
MTNAVPPLPDIFRRFRALTYTLVLLAVGGLAFAESNAPLFALILAAVAISWVLVESRPTSPALPRPLINVGVLIVAGVLFAELVFSRVPNLLPALGHFMTGIVACKLFERKAARDYAQMLTLTLLIMVAGAILSASLVFAFILIAYLALGLYAILLLHLSAETELAHTENLTPAGLPLSADGVIALRGDVRRVATYSSLLLIVVAAGVFLAVPRTRGQGFFSTQWSPDATIRTGFSDHVRFSDYGSLQQSDAIVMEVKLEQEGVNIGSEFYQPYFRGMALTTYDTIERQWSRPATFATTQETVSPDAPVPLLQGDFSSLGLVTQQYTMHSFTGNYLFTLAPPVSLASDRDLDIDFSPVDFSVSLRGGAPQPLRYTIESAVVHKPFGSVHWSCVPGDLGLAERSDGDFPRHNVVPPEIHRLAVNLVQDILLPNTLPTVEQIRPIADLFEQYLRTNYPYSLTFEAKDPTLDPTADFLLNRKDTGGHCEYFASAMVMLCRSVGINARMVTGYHGGDFNSISGLYVVRQKYAHAWVEVAMPNRGWVLYDPSPAATDIGNGSVVAKWFRDISEIVQKGWQSTIIAFDKSTQSYIFNALIGFGNAALSAAKTLFAETAEGVGETLFMSSTSASTRLITAGGILLVLGLGIWLIQHWRRQRSSQLPYILRKVDRKSQRQLAHELLFFDELLRILARTGLRKRIEQTPREYVEALAPALHNAAPDARWLIATFYNVRFGTLRVSAGLRSQIAAALRHVREQTNPHH